MGLNNEHAHIAGRPWMAFDIETCPMPSCGDYLTDPIEAPANYKDPDKIAKYIEERRQKQIADAGLDLDLCEVVAVGIALPVGIVYAQTRASNSEEDMLRGLWSFVKNAQAQAGVLVGFNCLGFDLPVLLRRSLYLGIPTPQIAIDKYRHEGVIDVAHELTFGGRMTWRSLAFYCTRFGIPYDDSVDGSQIAQLVASGQWDAIEGHVRSDVTATAALAARCGFIYAPVPEPETAHVA